MTQNSDHMILDFSGPTPSIIEWQSIDDRIMGGQSQSTAKQIAGVGLRFQGQVSLENNGGFASIRSSVNSFNLSALKGLLVRVRGDGKTYKLSLRTDLFFDGVSYQSSFRTQSGSWCEIYLPFSDFAPTHHGLKLTTVAPMNISDIKTFGFFVADRQSGPFILDIAWIKGY